MCLCAWSNFLCFTLKNQSSCKDSYLDPGPVSFEKCSDGSLCTLVKVNYGGESIVPLGRSYNGKEWVKFNEIIGIPLKLQTMPI